MIVYMHVVPLCHRSLVCPASDNYGTTYYRNRIHESDGVIQEILQGSIVVVVG